MLEIENYESVREIISRDYETFSGLMLERYFRRVLIETKSYTRIGGWWDRKGEKRPARFFAPPANFRAIL